MFLDNRYHDPTLGVLISVDPLVSKTGELYIYASGNPTTLSDETGMS
jgi:RHS repeat-associated protein